MFIYVDCDVDVLVVSVSLFLSLSLCHFGWLMFRCFDCFIMCRCVAVCFPVLFMFRCVSLLLCICRSGDYYMFHLFGVSSV